MALLKYLKPRDGLPNPKGTLSQTLPSRAIEAANREVVQATSEAGRKRGPYKRYSAEERLQIGKYEPRTQPARSCVSVISEDIIAITYFLNIR